MKMTNKEKARRQRQKMLNKQFIYTIVVNLLIVFVILLVVVATPNEVSGKNEIEDESDSTVYESTTTDHNTETSSANASDETTQETIIEEVKFSRNLSENDKYLLAKMAMAEAEGESLETKIYVILTILNRVNSEDRYFPDTIEEVIFQNNGKVYQFSPIAPGGRWWKVEPNKECWEAVEIVNSMEEDISMGALYFESCKGESWHSRNLEFILESDGMRFYK